MNTTVIYISINYLQKKLPMDYCIGRMYISLASQGAQTNCHEGQQESSCKWPSVSAMGT